MPVVAVQDLSLCGILDRLQTTEELKSKARPDDDDEATMASEVEVKKALGERLELLKSPDDRGLTSNEKAKTAAFIDVQIKGLDPNAKGAEVRRTKLGEMKALVQSAASAEEPAHVRRAKDAVAKGKKDFKAIQEKYEKWEKGKLMFKTTEELTAMKKQHDELSKHLETLQAHFQEALLRKTSSGAVPEAARPVGATVAVGNRFGNAAKAKPKADPGVRTGGGGGYPSGGGGRGSGGAGDSRLAPAAAQISSGAFRAAQMAAEMRTEVEAPPAAAAPSRPRAPRAPVEEAPAPVLSFKCTVRAVCERLKIPEDEARDMATSSAEFRTQLDRDSWEWVQNRSLAIEKDDQDKQRAKEKKKMDKALNRVTAGTSAAVAVAPLPSAYVQPAAKPAPKPKPKSKSLPKAKAKTANLSAMASGNQWGGLEDSDSDDGEGWSTVAR